MADLFALLSAVRFAVVEGTVSTENALLITQEYENIAQKIGTVLRPSPFVSSEDFSVPQLPAQKSIQAISIKDSNRPLASGIDKGHLPDSPVNPKGHAPTPDRATSTQRGERLALILNFIRKNKNVSIKDISSVVKDYSEKTIQRELSALIKQGLVRKEGQRRWSVYIAVSGI